ncbi:MAG: transposase [Anaerolineales bacterium]|nr:transposase [Anaerolineales bacterium]
MSNLRLSYGEYYHICHRGNNREALFREERNYKYFIDLYKKYIYPIADLYAYCLLPTHFHFLLRIKSLDELEGIYQVESQIWRQVRTFLGTYTKSINKTYNRSGHLFEGRYPRKITLKDEYFFHLISYIHQNPQTHGIVANFRIWPYSSYQAYKLKDVRSAIAKSVFSDLDLYNTILTIQEMYLFDIGDFDYFHD